MSTSSAPSDLTDVLKIPKPVYLTSCPKFICTGAVPHPDLSRMKKVDELLVKIWREVAFQYFISQTCRCIEQELRDSILSLVVSNSPSAAITILAIFRKKLWSMNEKMEKTIMSEVIIKYSHTLSQIRPTAASPITCVCALSKYFSGLKRLGKTIHCQAQHCVATILAEIYFKKLERTSDFTPAQLTKIVEKSPVQQLSHQLVDLSKDYFLSESSASVSMKAFIDTMAWMGGNRILAVANQIYLAADKRKSAIPIYSKNPLPFYQISKLVIKNQGGAVTMEYLNGLKCDADRLANKGESKEAISLYSIVAELAPIIIDARINCAKVRGRIAKDTDITQFEFIVIDCTYALEMEPNHLKALYLRGLAFCKLKMWKEGIVDFQRAVEFNPRTPGKRELEYALRQATRRIGA